MSASTAVRSNVHDGTWLEAAPFRAHVRHVMAAEGIDAETVAVLAGVSVPVVRHLLHGRRGRAVRRISPLTARSLYRLTPELARMMRCCLIPVPVTRARLRRLQAAGHSEHLLAAVTGLSPVEIRNLLDASTTHCTQLTALRVAAAARAMEDVAVGWRRRDAGPGATDPSQVAVAA
jgi:hypothetical protein